MAEPLKQTRPKNPGASIARPPLLKIVLLELALLVVLLVPLMVLDGTLAWSVMLGAGIAIGPNAYFTHSAFRYRGASAAQLVARSFYRGEAVKFITTAILFALVFALVEPLKVVWLFLAFIAFTAANSFLAVRYLKVQH